MAEGGERDWVRSLGLVMVIAGVGMWVPYAVGKYILGWAITDRDFLPYHLAVIIPGMALLYYRQIFYFRSNGPLSQKPESADLPPPARRSGPALKVLIIVNNFAHDLATGLWASSIIVISVLKNKSGAFRAVSELSSVLQELMRFFFWLSVLSILVILATGSFRVFYFEAETAARERETKKKLLIVKHVFFTTIFIGGTYLGYLYAFR